MRLLLILLLLSGCTQGVMIQSHSLPVAEAREICTKILDEDSIGCWVGHGANHQIWFPVSDYCIAAHELRHAHEGYWHKDKRYNCAELI